MALDTLDVSSGQILDASRESYPSPGPQLMQNELSGPTDKDSTEESTGSYTYIPMPIMDWPPRRLPGMLHSFLFPITAINT